MRRADASLSRKTAKASSSPPSGVKWLAGEHNPVEADIAKWHKYTTITKGNHLMPCDAQIIEAKAPMEKAEGK
jgi:hypothetical protein